MGMKMAMFNFLISRRFQQSRCTAPKTVPIHLILFAMILLDGFRGIAGATAQPVPPPDQLNKDTDKGDVTSVGSVGVGVGVGNIDGSNIPFKRNWQSLQGAWGKRSMDAGISAELNDGDDDAYFSERRVPIPLYLRDENSPNPVLKYSLVFLKNENGGSLLDHLLNREDFDDEGLLDTHDNNNQKKTAAATAGTEAGAVQYEGEIDSNDGIMADNQFGNEKRAWNSMNVAWGKRRNPPQWNKFRGAWGKREPGWNNLKGMWGKRSPRDWQKLHGSWGKRAYDTN